MSYTKPSNTTASTTESEMQQVITSKQAKAILGGRTPLMPVEYEEAVRALHACVTLDEAKYWDNKADALAAWAKIYRSTDAERYAKQLKLRAYRRMGELAQELRPGRVGAGRGNLGPLSVLRENGLNQPASRSAMALARMSPEMFRKEMGRDRIRSPNTVRTFTHSPAGSDASHTAYVGLMALRCNLRKCTPHQLASEIGIGPKRTMRDVVREIGEWLDEFDRILGNSGE